MKKDKRQLIDQITTLRPETLTIGKNWIRPTPDEVLAVKQMTGLPREKLEKFLGLSAKEENIMKWCSYDDGPESLVPYTSWAIMCHKAGLGKIWKK